MDSEGKAGILKEVTDWSKVDVLKMTQEESDMWEQTIQAFLLNHTKAEIFEQALRRGIILLPGYTVSEMVSDKHLEARDYWTQVPHPELSDTITYPGAPCRLSQTPWKVRFRAPLIGEHNDQVYCAELGLSKHELSLLKQRNVI
jgi:crotonobetainyl-CoA:carnitine CoA-transferase CaiB-like acyl-CoA transferase